MIESIIFSSTCLEQPSVLPQEDLYVQFNVIFFHAFV